MSLTTYLLTAGSEAYENGHSIITPVASKPILPIISPSTYSYWLGPSIFVDPVLTSNATTQIVHFPKGSDFVDWKNKSMLVLPDLCCA
jgi:alpha-glucosidase (family GH31 glycosyl hydrolase)